MQLTYPEALGAVLEPTGLGYTLESQDKLWTVFIFDLWSDDEYRYNRLFSLGIGKGWAYEPDIDCLFWTSRAEAEVYSNRLQLWLLNKPEGSESKAPTVYVMNWGDDARFENMALGHLPGARMTPKYRGSEEAWRAMMAMNIKASRHYARLEKG